MYGAPALSLAHGFLAMIDPILIHSFPNDLHADAVRWALGELGAPVVFWPSGAFPAAQTLTMEIAPGGACRHSVRTGDAFFDLPRFKTVWNRRRRPPAVSRDLNEKDVKFVERECVAHLNSMPRLISPEALWVNPPRAAEQDIYKPLQLKTAAEVGFSIPDTLFSNDPAEIKDFFGRHDGNIVYKSYRGAAWAREPGLDDKIAMGFTADVVPEDLEQEAALRAAPGIFQRKVAKDHEVRVTVMGRTVTAVKILSQEDETTKDDWRVGYVDIKIAPFFLPEKIAALCHAYMKKARLNFGCFDFIVTPDGEYYFLEINQMGQFLWQEILQPDLPLLQIFCDFLMSADPTFERRDEQPRVSFKAYLASEAGQDLDRRMRRQNARPRQAASA